MANRTFGTFEVKLRPQSHDATAEGAAPGRMSIKKQFQSDLLAMSKGGMLTALSRTPEAVSWSLSPAARLRDAGRQVAVFSERLRMWISSRLIFWLRVERGMRRASAASVWLQLAVSRASMILRFS